jgi:phage gp45-like
MDATTAMALRGLVVRAVVRGTGDAGETQTVEAETHEGILRSGIEVLQPFGVASRPPAQGAIAVLLAVGGDQGDMVALPLACPSARFGDLAAGETVVHDAAGNRLHFRAGGLVEVAASTSLKVTVGGTELLVNATGVTITGDLVVTGQVSDANGSMQEMRDRYNGHVHGATPGPSPIMD